MKHYWKAFTLPFRNIGRLYKAGFHHGMNGIKEEQSRISLEIQKEIELGVEEGNEKTQARLNQNIEKARKKTKEAQEKYYNKDRRK